MSKTADQSLVEIAGGTGFFFLGTVVVMLCGFVGRVLLARFFTQTEYGIYSLTIVLMHILVIFSMLGLHEGLPRQIAYYRGKGDEPKVSGVIGSALKMAIVAGVPVSLALFFSSDIISTKAFHDPGLSISLKIFSVAIPFFILIQMLSGVFRGFGKVKPKVYFMDVLRNGLFILLLALVIVLKLPFEGALFACSISFIITGVSFAIYTKKRAAFSMKGEGSLVFNSIDRELLLFSLPLTLVYTLNDIMQYTDTIMIGFFKTIYDVGLYNAAVPISQFVNLLASSMIFIYKPIVTGLYSQGAMIDIKQIYQSSTKWLMLLAFPIFLIIFLFPKPVIGFLFGQEYVGASPALQILALSSLSVPLLGPQGSTLMAMGKNNLLMYIAVAGAITNIILNLILVPLMGITGAAVATLVSWGGVQLINLILLYKIAGIHPFSQKLFKPMAVSLVASLAIYFVVEHFFTVTAWMLPVLAILFFIIYFVATLLTRSFDDQALNFVVAMETRTGIDLSLLKAILGRFM